MTPVEAVLRFVEKINAHDVSGLLALMTEDHCFIDSLGNTLTGREGMRSAWESYFARVPDYSLRVTETFDRAGVVALLGTAHGSYAVEGRLVEGSRWETPAACRAVVREDKLAEWRVYADNEPIRAIMRREP